MKGRFLMLGALCALAALAVVMLFSPDAAFAATGGHAAAHASWGQMAIEASPALIALRAQLKEVTDKAAAKIGEVVEGLAAERVSQIEAEHRSLLTEAEQIRTQIAEEEQRHGSGDDPVAAATARAADITSIGMRAGWMREEIDTAIRGGETVDQVRTRAFDSMAARDGQQPIAPAHRGRQDDTETRRRAMQEALEIGLAPSGSRQAEPSAAARQFMGFSIIDLAAERLGERRVPGDFGAREQILRRAFHSTSDFPLIFEGALNTSLAARYALQNPTYRRIARQRSYTDFRDHNTVRAGDFPDLQPVNPEGGEIKAGTFSESKEKTAVKAYGVRVDFSRQMLVNDRLNALVQVLNDRGAAVARFEDRTFYAMMLSGAGADGPTLLDTARQVFNTTDKTKAGAGAAIGIASLSEGRAALRKRVSKDKAELELVARILLVGPDKETEAQQIIAPIQAQQAGNVNPFSGTLELVVTAKIVGNPWFMFASPDEAPCFEWGLLDGYTAPRFRTENPFGVQGVSMSLEHDFGCGAIDFRGGWKNAGN